MEPLYLALWTIGVAFITGFIGIGLGARWTVELLVKSGLDETDLMKRIEESSDGES